MTGSARPVDNEAETSPPRRLLWLLAAATFLVFFQAFMTIWSLTPVMATVSTPFAFSAATPSAPACTLHRPSSRNPPRWGDRARAHKGLKQWDQAEADYAQALTFTPDDADLRIERGRFFEQRSRPDKAVAEFTAAIGQKTKLVDRRRAAFARAPYQKAYRQGLSKAFEVLAEVYRKVGRPADAARRERPVDADQRVLHPRAVRRATLSHQPGARAPTTTDTSLSGVIEGRS